MNISTTTSSSTPDRCGMQEEVALADKRQELFTLFRNAAKVAPAEAGRFVAERLGRALADASASVQDVEVNPDDLTCNGPSSYDTDTHQCRAHILYRRSKPVSHSAVLSYHTQRG